MPRAPRPPRARPAIPAPGRASPPARCAARSRPRTASGRRPRIPRSASSARAEARRRMIVHHPGRLHERIADGRTDELEAAPAKLAAHRLARRERLAVAGAAQRLRADEAPGELVEAAELFLHLEERARIRDHRLDLRAV